MLSTAITPAHAAFPGLNGRIACSTPLGGPGGTAATTFGAERLEIFTVKPDGTDEVRLTSTLAGSLSATAPKYSADGRKIVFQQNNQIWTMNADGTNPTQLTTTSFGANTPGSWSPDGTKIVFHANREPVPPGSPAGSNTNEIYTIDADGSNLTRLTNNLRQDSHPGWSPDGTKIVFRSNRDLNFDIYVMNADGTDQTNLTMASPAEESGPDWSPDGKQIAFHTDRDAFGIGRVLNRNLEIYRMNADGSNPTRLTFTDFSGGGDPNLDLTGYDLLPAWSPQGDRIVFHSGRGEEFRNTGEINGSGMTYVAQWDVYTINATDGSDIRRVTNRPRNDEHCDWQPLARPAAVRPPVRYPVPLPLPSAGRLKTSLTLKAKPRRDRKLPFRYRFTGSVRIPPGKSKAAVCGGTVRLSLKRGRRTAAKGTARVSKTCTYRKVITIRRTRITGKRKGRLRVAARFGGNASLLTSRKSTTVRFF
jgi:Tol biopolymer transport system component